VKLSASASIAASHHLPVADFGGVAEVQKRNPAVIAQQVVAGMRIGVETPESLHRSIEEARDDLADAVALGLVELQDLIEALAVDPFGDEHAAAAQRGEDRRHEDERVAAVGPRERPLILRLELEVELFEHALAQLACDQPRVDARRDDLPERDEHRGQIEIRLERIGDFGVLHLDRDATAVGEHAAMDLADRRRGERLVLELREQLLDRLVPLDLEHALDLVPAHRRRRVAQVRELLLVDLAVLRRKELHVDERGQLTDLHRPAAEVAEDLGGLVGDLHVPGLEHLPGALGRAREVRQQRSRQLRPARPERARRARRTGDLAGGDVVVVARHRSRL
jgi:hypothetical protein